ncbi:ornithine carbamoyltransferase [candidate division MSBL1 archaeon SCGC-AAA385D11]|uniref:Ornithine carbamoyltransferase n=1 Tax=candidate division MSBL1 archaeon SCGC-AAA385D11 TaxID=1698286 RepID=A0A133VNX5_9EURY|nr:ornithine carbamoyltransferase [candidate division MSBL1 archaeon SCGC-AAA385D11]
MAKVKHLLSVLDLSDKELLAILKRAEEFKSNLGKKKRYEPLYGKSLAMLFTKPSTRTRISFETAMTQLGGHAIYLDQHRSQLERRETIEDTGKTISRYVDALVARFHEHEKIEKLARNSRVPVINGLTDLLHPCQTISDLFTIREKKGRLEGLKLAYVGDGNNVCNSLLLSCSKAGVNISVANPKGYEPDATIVKNAKEKAEEKGTKLGIITDPNEAVLETDVIYTDAIVSMGQKGRERRLKDFREYQVDAELMKKAKKDVIFMHCLPAHRGEEVSAEIIDGPHSVVFDQAENRLHVQKAILEEVM